MAETKDKNNFANDVDEHAEYTIDRAHIKESASGGTAQIKNVQSVALADATAKQKPSLWTRRMFQLYLILLLATLNAAVNGYDGSVMSSINSYVQYREYFGFSLTEGTPATGIVYAMFTIGNLVGAAVAGPAGDVSFFQVLILRCWGARVWFRFPKGGGVG
ncbi:hypothetical protein ACMFMG_004056 [Clarireedia jacksonii]